MIKPIQIATNLIGFNTQRCHTTAFDLCPLKTECEIDKSECTQEIQGALWKFYLKIK
jgi:hypothetical protein